jgi:hypothetical protein
MQILRPLPCRASAKRRPSAAPHMAVRSHSPTPDRLHQDEWCAATLPGQHWHPSALWRWRRHFQRPSRPSLAASLLPARAASGYLKERGCSPSLLLAAGLHCTARPELAVHSADDAPHRPLTPRALGLFSPRFLCRTLPPKRLRVRARRIRRGRFRSSTWPSARTHALEAPTLGLPPTASAQDADWHSLLPRPPGPLQERRTHDSHARARARARAAARSRKGPQTLIPTRVTPGLCHTSMSQPGPVVNHNHYCSSRKPLLPTLLAFPVSPSTGCHPKPLLRRCGVTAICVNAIEP